MDAFTRFGLKPAFDIDTEKLEKLYLNLQRNLHPDRFAAKSAKERAIAEGHSSDLNRAFEILDDPLRRAIYLLDFLGQRPTAGTEQTVEDKELLMEMLERREKLAEAVTTEEIETLAAEAGAQTLHLLPLLSAAFAAGDLSKADAVTVRFKYLRKFLEETRARLAVMAAA